MLRKHSKKWLYVIFYVCKKTRNNECTEMLHCNFFLNLFFSKTVLLWVSLIEFPKFFGKILHEYWHISGYSYTHITCNRINVFIFVDMNFPFLLCFDIKHKKLLQLNLSQTSSRWLPRCAALFDTFKDLCLPLIPESEQGSPVGVQELFNCMAALMSLQLRSLVIESLQDLLYYFTIHEVS